METSRMETQPDEQISDSFLCCVCLDLLYKPIVLACGHVSCFWCVHRCMNGLRESHCPICRHPYHHFPTICQMLHFLLLKMYPITYKSRETQALEFEKAKEIFSPDLNDLVCASHNSEGLIPLGNVCQSSHTNSRFHLSPYPCSFKDGESCYMEQLEFSPSKEHSPVSIADVLCVACKELLFRPVVLNCGHVYCETCIGIPVDERLKCNVCKSSHPSGFPKVCLELDHFLEDQFPSEYAQRRVATQIKQVNFQQKVPTTGSAEAPKQGVHFTFPSEESFWPSSGDHNLNVHFGVGCDFCGMCPITGNRYKCKDCVEVIGFDLCEECYNTSSKRPGRFNQQHTPDHKFEIVRSNSIRSMILRLIRGQLQGGPAAPDLPNNNVDIPENVPPPAIDDDLENAENGLVGPIIEDQSDEQLGPM